MNEQVYRFKPTTKQFRAYKALIDDTYTEIGYGGSAHSGKSYLGVFWVLTQAVQYPYTRWLIGRKELTNLKKTTYKTLLKLIAEMGYDYQRDFHEDGKLNIITTPNKSELVLMDMAYKPSDPMYARLGGLELTGAFLDESNEIKSAGIEILKSRIGRQKNVEYGLLGKILETFNPDQNHVYRRYYLPYKNGDMPAHRIFIPALPTDNPHTPPQYIEQLKRSDPTTRERLLYGNFEYADTQTALFPIDAINNMFRESLAQDDYYLVGDIARMGRDKTVLGVWRGLDLVEVHTIDKSRLNEVVNMIHELQSRFSITNERTVIDEDGVGGGVVDSVRCKGFVGGSSPINRSKSDVKETQFKVNYKNLRAQCYYKLSDLIRDNKITVSSKLVAFFDTITEELQFIKAKDPGSEAKLSIVSKQDIKDNLGRSPDFADMLMMRMYFEVQPEKKTPRVFYKQNRIL